MLRAIDFDLPIRRPNDRYIRDRTGVSAIGAFLAAHRTCFVGGSVKVNHVGHLSDYTADACDRV